MVREHVTVALSGDGGDELSGGYSHYARKGLARALDRFVLTGRRVPGPHIETLLEGNSPWSRLRRTFLYRFVYPEIKPLYRSEYFQGPLKRELLKGTASESSGDHAYNWRKEWISESFKFATNTIERMLWLDSGTYLPGDVLAKIDIASMAYGLEVRSPFLDTRVVERCARLPANIKVNNGTRKYLLKKLTERFLPREMLDRRKQGFSAPVPAWLRGPMQGFLRQSLAAVRSRMSAYLNGDFVDRLVEEHTSGKTNHGARLWILLNLALWEAERS